MRNKMYMKLGMIAVAGASMAAANAQSNGASGLSARVGVFFPSNNLAQNLSSTWFVFGADLKLSGFGASVPGTGLNSYLGLSADYYYHGSDSDIPVALTYNLRAGQMVYSAGIGPDFRNSGDLTSTGVGIGEQVAATYEFGNMPTPMFIQAKYFFSSRPELSGFGVYLGIRF